MTYEYKHLRFQHESSIKEMIRELNILGQQQWHVLAMEIHRWPLSAFEGAVVDYNLFLMREVMNDTHAKHDDDH